MNPGAGSEPGAVHIAARRSAGQGGSRPASQARPPLTLNQPTGTRCPLSLDQNRRTVLYAGFVNVVKI